MLRFRLSLACCLTVFTLAACGGPEDAPAVSSDDTLSDVVGSPCASTASCGKGEVCTTEDGVCNRPPGCTGTMCPSVCYGTCRVAGAVGPACGTKLCPAGQVCCNASCGTCTPPGWACTQVICPRPVSRCKTDADCRKFSDYCQGCNCRALSVCEKDPVCTGGVQCLLDPCASKEAYCNAGTCALRPSTATCPVQQCGPVPPMGSSLCADGKTMYGFTGRCLQRADGSCSWEVASCPDRSICATTW